MNSGNRQVSISRLFNRQFNLTFDLAPQQEIVDNISKGAEISGINLWLLMGAILMASIGLSVNSTAVVIGAMLISPLMGPIYAVSLSVHITDMELLHKAFKNLMFASLVAIVTSFFYFLLSPIIGAQSELLARTTPTIWDVLLALFGGMCGMIAATRNSSSNVVPGVAIATALMPPLCTAGHGLAAQNFAHFSGALYLFFINVVFIGTGAFVIIQRLHLKSKAYAQPELTRKIKRMFIVIVLVTALPSIYLAHKMVFKSRLQSKVQQFLKVELGQLTDVEVISSNLSEPVEGKQWELEVILLGRALSKEKKDEILGRLPQYDLSQISLQLKEASSGQSMGDLQQIKSGIIEEMYRENEKILRVKEERIKLLEDELINFKQTGMKSVGLGEEIKALNPQIERVVVGSSLGGDEGAAVFIKVITKIPLAVAEKNRLKRFLTVKYAPSPVYIVW